MSRDSRAVPVVPGEHADDHGRRRRVYLVLSLVMLRYVDEALLAPSWKWLARTGAPIAAILIPAAFFLSVASPSAKEPNGLMNLAYIGALFLAAAVLSLGVGLIRAARQKE